VKLRAAAVVIRDEDGKVVIKDEVGESYGVATATGGIIGLLIGIIAAAWFKLHPGDLQPTIVGMD